MKTKGKFIIPAMILVFIFILITLVFFNTRQISEESEILDHDSVSITGIVWTSGLQKENKEALGIDSDYQVSDLQLPDKWNEKITGMFLITDNIKLSEYLGKCVIIKGKVKEGWEDLEKNNYEINGKWTFNRSVLIIDKISEEEIAKCIGSYDRTVKGEEQSGGIGYKTAVGVLSFAKRPAPDINYDLEIILHEPFIDELNAQGYPVVMKKLDIFAGSDEIYRQIINNIGNKVEVGGYLQWGHAETRFLNVDLLRVL